MNSRFPTGSANTFPGNESTVAATVAKPRKGRVYVVHIIEVTRSLPLNAELDAEARRGEQLIRQAEEVAAHAGYPVSGTLLQAREAGSAILEEALEAMGVVVWPMV